MESYEFFLEMLKKFMNGIKGSVENCKLSKFQYSHFDCLRFFLNALKTNIEDIQNLGTLFRQNERQFDMYSEYIKYQPYSERILNDNVEYFGKIQQKLGYDLNVSLDLKKEHFINLKILIFIFLTILLKVEILFDKTNP